MLLMVVASGAQMTDPIKPGPEKEKATEIVGRFSVSR